MNDRKIPSWLSAFLEKVAKCFECTPDVIEWQVGLDTGEDIWHAVIYPAPTLVDGEIVYPEVQISLGDAMGVFDEVDYMMWFSGGAVISEHVEISGKVAGNDVSVEVHAQAPDETPAVTKMNADGSWEHLS